MSEHTPGKWQISGPYIRSRISDDVSKRIARFYADTKTMYVGEAEANANILAAAPDLLAACKGALALLEVNHEGWCIRTDGPEFVALRKAIAKAEGRGD